MQFKLRREPLLVCRPRIWLNILSIIGLLIPILIWIAMFNILNLHIFTVFFGMLIIFSAIRMLINLPSTLYIMPNGLVIIRFRNYQEIAWHDIDFIIERGWLDKRLIIGSKSFPKILSIEGVIQNRKWYPVHVLWRGHYTNFDEAQLILKKRLQHKYRLSFWL